MGRSIYEWKKNFCGIELMYRQSKFGEYYSPQEFFADTEPLQLLSTVREVASIVFGSLLHTLQQRFGEEHQVEILRTHLIEHGLQQFDLIGPQE